MTTDQHDHAPARGCCAEHTAFRQRATTALNLAIADDMDGARAAVQDLQTHHGPGALTAALLTWVDIMVTRTPGTDHSTWANPEAAAEAAEASDPATSWAIQVTIARLARDRSTFEALRAAVQGSHLVETYVMGLLALIATHLADETRNV
ncbi:hypothetical protein [Streptosporangium sp. NPDC000509]|uniref:hypothetical protein n=1 Tax=Streptosporangium sp. NPDC000509 TaxID=3366186 RepID=UPI003698A175